MAYRLLDLLEQRILSGNREQILGYTKFSEMIGWAGGAASGQAAGGAASVLDYACFVSRMPMLASHYIRNPDGGLPPGWSYGVWGQFADEMLDVSARHEWTKEDFARIRASLCGLDAKSGESLWAEAAERGTEYIRYNLHRRVRSVV